MSLTITDRRICNNVSSLYIIMNLSEPCTFNPKVCSLPTKNTCIEHFDVNLDELTSLVYYFNDTIYIVMRDV